MAATMQVASAMSVCDGVADVDVMTADVRGIERNVDRRSPQRRSSRGGSGSLSAPVITSMVRISDLAVLLLAGGLAGAWLPLYYHALRDGAILLASLSASVVSVVGLSRSKAYGVQALRSTGHQLRLAMGPLLMGAASSIVCLFLLQDAAPHVRRWPVAWLAISAVLFAGTRLVLSRLMVEWLESGQLARRVAVVGAGKFSKEFIARLREEPHAYTVVGLYDDRLSRIPATQDGVTVRGTVEHLLARSRAERIDVIAVALPLEAVSRIRAILEQLGSAVADVCLTTDLAGLHYTSGEVAAVGANPVILVSERPFKDWRAVSKSAFDMVLAGMLLVGLLPLMVVVAALIRLDSPGPVLFRQPRRGFNHQMFACFKFRTMRVEMTDLLADRQTTRDDPRVTRVGRLLRKSSLDELPQLLNVLRGEMSLVGPRPHAPNTKAADQLFEDVVSQYATRHRVKPGITGWAQVNGWRGETKTVEQIKQRVACDLSYIERWSLLFDVKILAMTVVRGLFATNAF